jgi:hypothetical protein
MRGGRQRSEVGSRRAEGRSQRSEVRKSEARSQEREDRRQEIGEGAGMAPFFVIPERFYRGTRTSCGFPLKTCENDSDGGTCGMTAVVEYAGKVI